MVKLNLDLKKFKHVKSDDKSTTLQHPDGHLITVAHKPLSKEFQKQLAALSSVAKEDETPVQKEEESSKMAMGGKVKPHNPDRKMKAHGGEADSDMDENAFYRIFGVPVQRAADSLGMKLDNGVAKIAQAYHNAVANKQIPVQQPVVQKPPPPPTPIYNSESNMATLANQGNYEKQFKAKDAANAAAELAYQQRQNSADRPVDMEGYKTYREAQPEQAPVQRPMPLPNNSQQSEQQFDAAATKAAGMMPANQRPMPKQGSPDIQEEQQPDYNQSPDVNSSEYAEGGDVEPDPNQVMTPNPKYQPPFDSIQDQPEQAPVNPYAAKYGQYYDQFMKTIPVGTPPEEAKALADRTALNAVESQKSADEANVKIAQEDAEAQQQQILQTNARRQAIGLQPLPVPSVPQLPGADAAPQQPQANATMQPIEQAKQGVEAASGQPMGMSANRDPESMLETGYQDRMTGINQQAKAQGYLGQMQNAALQKGLQDQANAQQTFQNSYKQLEKERQDHMQDIKDGYIDPNAYWKDHSKIMSGIGMILAGFNPTNSPNAAINFLKFQMEQNLEAQKTNLGAKQNMLNANLHQFGNLRDAMDMTRVMQNDIMSHELQAAAAKAASPMAKAAALQAAGQLQMESAPMFQQFAMRRAMMNLANGGGSPDSVDHLLGYMRVVNPEMAKEMESRYVPHVGLAAIPVPQEARNQMIAKQQFGEAVKDLQAWAMQHSGSLSPSAIAEGKTKAANVQNLYRQGINGGVFKQGEQSFINNIVDSEPTKFFNSIRVLPKLNEVIRENDNSLNVLKRAYKLPEQPQQAAPQYKVDKNHVKWMRGPKGEAIRVK